MTDMTRVGLLVDFEAGEYRAVEVTSTPSMRSGEEYFILFNGVEIADIEELQEWVEIEMGDEIRDFVESYNTETDSYKRQQMPWNFQLRLDQWTKGMDQWIPGCLVCWEASDYWDGIRNELMAGDLIYGHRLTADMSDQDLEEMAEALDDEAKSDSYAIECTAGYLRYLRDRLRDKSEEENEEEEGGEE